MPSLSPIVCASCAQKYTFKQRMVTWSCGHSMCEKCAQNTNKCMVCQSSNRIVPHVDMATLLCAGCGTHYMQHETVVNQVRILECGHRSMCKHTTQPTCAICAKKSTHTVVDVSLTAMMCRVSIRYPDVPPVQHVRPVDGWYSCCPCVRNMYNKM